MGFLILFLMSFLLPVQAYAQTTILGPAREWQPGYGQIENFTIVSYTDLDGWDRPTEIRVTQDAKIAYTAHNPPPQEGRNNGVTIIDVSNPSQPRVLARAVNPPGVHSQYVGIIGNLLVLNQEKVRLDRVGGVRPELKTWDPGIRLFDVRDPAKPREVGYFKSDDLPGEGVHGFWLHEDPKAGKLAFIATTKRGYLGYILMIVDINDPAKPKEVSRWWYPGTWTAGGEKAGKGWFSGGGARRPLPDIWLDVHDVTVYKDRAYVAHRDQGVVILDISDIRKPAMVGQIKWSPPDEGNTHSIGIVIPKHGGRPDLIVVTDEITQQCPWGYMRIIDVRHEQNPVQISTFRLPLNKFCPPDRPGRDFGIHDIDRMIRGNIVFGAWQQSGFWAVDISDPYQPRSAGYFVPPPFTRGGLDYSTADDVFVHDNGLIFASSNEPGGGLWILKYTPGVKGTVSWTLDNNNVVVKYEKK